MKYFFNKRDGGYVYRRREGEVDKYLVFAKNRLQLGLLSQFYFVL